MTEIKSSREDVLQFLETLDTYSQTPPPSNPTTSGKTGGEVGVATKAEDAQSVLDFLDQITQNTDNASIANNTSIADATSTTPAPAATNNVNFVPESIEGEVSSTTQAQTSKHQQKQSGNWSWGGLLSTASTAYKTASTVVDSSVKGALATVETTVGNVRANESTKKLEETVRGYVNKEAIGKIGADLKTLGLSTLNTVVNVVAPPIAEHEVVEVWLAHDMVGYVGVEALVYKAFMKVMEQVEGGDIVVRKGNEVKKKDADEEEYRDLNICEGFNEAVGLAMANIEQIIKKNYTPQSKPTEQESDESSAEYLETTCPVFMAIQPTKASPYAHPPSDTNEAKTTPDPDKYLFYVIALSDPTHKLTFKTFSQSLPVHWLDIPYEENEWVEEKMVEALKLAVQSVAQDYVWARMTGDGKYRPPARVEVPIVQL